MQVQSKDEPAKTSTGQTPPTRTATPALQVTLGPIYDAYFNVQMALAQDDLDSARVAAGDLKKLTDAVNPEVFSKADQKNWKKLSGLISASSGKIAATDKVNDARDAFFELSQATIDLHTAFGHAGKESFYLTYCPMARGNQGAHWLQNVDVVWNSYYGSQMLRCGSIQKEFKPASMGTAPE